MTYRTITVDENRSRRNDKTISNQNNSFAAITDVFVSDVFVSDLFTYIYIHIIASNFNNCNCSVVKK